MRISSALTAARPLLTRAIRAVFLKAPDYIEREIR